MEIKCELIYVENNMAFLKYHDATIVVHLKYGMGRIREMMIAERTSLVYDTDQEVTFEKDRERTMPVSLLGVLIKDKLYTEDPRHFIEFAFEFEIEATAFFVKEIFLNYITPKKERKIYAKFI